MGDLVLSVHPAIHDKPPLWLSEYASSWQRCQTDLEGLAELIAAGRAFIPVAMSSQHRSSEVFLHADLVVIDIDEGLDLDGFRQHPMAAHAALLYTTSSHRPEPGQHRFRVIFRLPQRIDDGDLYKALVTLLIRAFGGDKSCSDPCRLFYGCSTGEQQWLHPEAVLPAELIEQARQLVQQWSQRLEGNSDYDDLDIGQAIYVLEEVLEPTADGQRDLFVRITAAAASAGSDLYPAWSDWASRGHHGKGKNARQTSERFFRGFSGRSSLATLFFLAGEQDPNWRRSMPEHLRKSGGGFSVPAAGYAMADFMGSEDDFLDLDPEQRPAAPAPTPSIFEITEATVQGWRELNKPAIPASATQKPSAPEQPAPEQPTPEAPALYFSTPEPPPLPPELDDPDDPFEGMGLDLIHANEADPPEDKQPDLSGDPLLKRGKKGRSKKSPADDDLTIPVIKEAVRKRYPSLRLNTLTYNLEYGPMNRPRVIGDPTMAYVPVSELAGRNMPKTLVTDVTRILGEENAYNPVKTYLEHCRKNAEPISYFDELAQVLLGVSEESTDNPRLPCGRLYADEVLRRFLVGAVARTMNPGCPHSWMLILVGPQNLGKSNFFQYLTPPSPLNNGYPWVTTIQQGIAYLKEKPHALHAGWLVLLDEVERYFKRQYTEELKNLISVANDRSARKYENERSFPRSFVLCGATNSMNFMVDPTGNRRFMPIRVPGKVPAPEDPNIKIIDLDRLKLDRDRIWAAAYQAYLDNPVHEFSSYELTRVEPVHGVHSLDSPLEGSLRIAIAKQCSFVHKGQPAYTMADLFQWLGLGVDRSTAMTRQISDELRRMGYENTLARIQGTPTRFWRKRQ
jgi:hypothetical protein